MSVYDKIYYSDHRPEYYDRLEKYRKKAHIKRVPLDVRGEWYDALKSFADEHDLSVNECLRLGAELLALHYDDVRISKLYAETEDEPSGENQSVEDYKETLFNRIKEARNKNAKRKAKIGIVSNE